MDSEFLQYELDYYPVTIYQFMCVPLAFIFYHLSITGHLSLTARYMFLLFGGFLMAAVSMGPYTILVLIPAVLSVILIHSLEPSSVHKWTFLTQMTWQTLCHLWLHYKDYYLQEATDIKFLITLSSLMLLTQRITSTSLDVHEGEITVPIRIMQRNLLDSELLHGFLLHLSYMLYFPALFGGPLCTFKIFKIHVENLIRTEQKCITSPLWPFFKKCILFFLLSRLRMLVRNFILDQGPLQWNAPKDILLIWITALMFRLAYYSQWLLNESLNNLIGLGLENKKTEKATLSDTDIWTLETTNKISELARTWNKTTANWLRRMVFQRRKVQPLLSTFAFSAWWHGLHPGQIFGFILWAITVQADYYIHRHMNPFIVRSRLLRFFYKPLTWVQTQLVTAYILVAVELRSFSCVLVLCKSACAVCPLLYVLLLICMPNMKQKLKVIINLPHASSIFT
ncbi:LOW QUALITY PROTEIN: ghrelin O-acyltransferase [Pristis pectinata]|uniref:LOW QUALITY PROTEIN: ghrelin O-acyltransferase n=1 Tax=Pristis pectinata TaxID=685728 RepID=UPI00223D0E23|nr:LOW QUALITY PROTEIN: ghrelin O-acyltransferase [Pristis pectinata]